MARVSVLQQIYLNQRQSIIEKSKKQKNKCWKENYGFCLVWNIIGILLGCIPFSVILIAYIKYLQTQRKSETTVSSSEVVLRWNTTGITIAGVTNQSGNASNKLYLPYGIILDWSNTLYITDKSNHRVQKYLRDASFGETVAGQKTGLNGASSSFLSLPTDLGVETNGDIYVSDTSNHRVQLWASGSTAGVTVAGTTGSSGSGSNQLNLPYGVVHDPISRALYITDSSNHRVMRYFSNASFGTVVAGGSGTGINNTQLSFPIGIHFDLISNSLLIANYGANNIVRWTLGAANWELIVGNENGISGSTSTGLRLPIDVILDPMGNSYVVDFNNQRIQFFPVGERNGTTIAGITGISGANATLLNFPASVALDNQLNLYVSDSLNHRIQKFMRY